MHVGITIDFGLMYNVLRLRYSTELKSAEDF